MVNLDPTSSLATSLTTCDNSSVSRSELRTVDTKTSALMIQQAEHLRQAQESTRSDGKTIHASYFHKSQDFLSNDNKKPHTNASENSQVSSSHDTELYIDMNKTISLKGFQKLLDTASTEEFDKTLDLFHQYFEKSQQRDKEYQQREEKYQQREEKYQQREEECQQRKEEYQRSKTQRITENSYSRKRLEQNLEKDLQAMREEVQTLREETNKFIEESRRERTSQQNENMARQNNNIPTAREYQRTREELRTVLMTQIEEARSEKLKELQFLQQVRNERLREIQALQQSRNVSTALHAQVSTPENLSVDLNENKVKSTSQSQTVPANHSTTQPLTSIQTQNSLITKPKDSYQSQVIENPKLEFEESQCKEISRQNKETTRQDSEIEKAALHHAQISTSEADDKKLKSNPQQIQDADKKVSQTLQKTTETLTCSKVKTESKATKPSEQDRHEQNQKEIRNLEESIQKHLKDIERLDKLIEQQKLQFKKDDAVTLEDIQSFPTIQEPEIILHQKTLIYTSPIFSLICRIISFMIANPWINFEKKVYHDYDNQFIPKN